MGRGYTEHLSQVACPLHVHLLCVITERNYHFQVFCIMGGGNQNLTPEQTKECLHLKALTSKIKIQFLKRLHGFCHLSNKTPALPCGDKGALLSSPCLPLSYMPPLQPSPRPHGVCSFSFTCLSTSPPPARHIARQAVSHLSHGSMNVTTCKRPFSVPSGTVAACLPPAPGNPQLRSFPT